MREGLNQYPPMAGVPALREAVARKIEALYGHRYDAGSEITITAGATQAILTAILCCVHPGDEVIVLEPCYDSYAPNIELAGGVRGARAADAGQLPARLRRASPRRITPRTRRHHRQHAAQPERHGLDAPPRCSSWPSCCAPTDVLLISDEVYEHMVFDGVPHVSARVDPGAGRAQPSSSRASARPTTSPAGRSATWPRRRR